MEEQHCSPKAVCILQFFLTYYSLFTLLRSSTAIFFVLSDFFFDDKLTPMASFQVFSCFQHSFFFFFFPQTKQGYISSVDAQIPTACYPLSFQSLSALSDYIGVTLNPNICCFFFQDFKYIPQVLMENDSVCHKAWCVLWLKVNFSGNPAETWNGRGYLGCSPVFHQALCIAALLKVCYFPWCMPYLGRHKWMNY